MKIFAIIVPVFLIIWWMIRRSNKKKKAAKHSNFVQKVEPTSGSSIGKGLIVLSSFIAFFSLFMTSADVRVLWFNFSPRTGFALKMGYTLAPWAYSVYVVVVGKRISWSSIIVVSAIVLILPGVIADKIDAKGWGPFQVDPGNGVSVLKLAGMILVIGLVWYRLAYPALESRVKLAESPDGPKRL